MISRPQIDNNNRAANARLQGIAAALAEIARTHGEPDLADAVLCGFGLTVADLEAAGADPYDVEALRAHWAAA